MKRRGQNLIEFIVVAPLLIILLFGIVELALFWRTAHTVQEIALEAAIAASTKYVAENAESNPAVEAARGVVEKRLPTLNLNNISLNDTNLGTEYGKRPFALYEFTSDGNNPVIRFTADYRDPYKNGVITQLIYRYTTMFLGAEFELAGGKKITIIPREIEISSTKIQQYINY